MTAISAALPMGAGRIPGNQASSKAAQSSRRDEAGGQSSFGTVLSSVPEETQEAGTTTANRPSKKDAKEEKSEKKEDRGQAIATPVVDVVRPRVVLPLTLLPGGDIQGQGTSDTPGGEQSSVAPSSVQPDTIPIQTPPARDLAFAMKMLETTPSRAPGVHGTSAPQPQNPAVKTTAAAADFRAAMAHAQVSHGSGADAQTPDSDTRERGGEAAQVETRLNTAVPAAIQTPEAPAPAKPVQTAEPVAARIIEPAHVESAGPAKSASANDISLQISTPDRTSASVRIVESGSELRVAVHASDSQLAETLRGGVEQLTSHLNNNGWTAEAWRPASIPSTAAVQSSASEMQQRHGSGEQPATPFSNRDRNNDREKRPDWVEEFDLCK